MSDNDIVTLNTEVEISDIRPLICELRGQAVMLDRDLASIYHVMTGRLNEAVKRNLARFPPEFMFQLSDLEMKELIANCDRFRMRQVHEDHLRHLPRPLHHRRPEGNLLDRSIAKGRRPLDLRRRQNGCGGHPWSPRFNPQGDVRKCCLSNGQIRRIKKSAFGVVKKGNAK